MWKNKEWKAMVAFTVLIEFIGLAVSISISWTAWFTVLAVCLGVDIVFGYYTYHRYYEIKHLSAYLMQVYSQGKHLDIRDNKEGELSILKNDIYKMTQTLREQAEYLHKDKVFLADTLSDISHQLKTPLTSMTVLCDVLSQPDLPEAKKHAFLLGMHAQLERMQWLVSSLLKLSKIDARAITFKSETIVLKDLLDTCIQSFSVFLEIKNIHLKKQYSSDIQLTTDKNWLKEAISNIIKNAVEHTPQDGEIIVTAEENPMHIRIMIINHGSKIDTQDLQHLFDRFYKGKNAGSDSIGIGLALSKSIIQHLHGQIACESDDADTRFIITFYKHVV